MSEPRLIRVADVPPQPWRNGGGITRELLAWPSPQLWSVRLSVAEVAADGPFSIFERTQRWFTVLDGDSVELTIDGAPRFVRRGDAPLCFDGEAKADCRLLDGPTRDVNLMLRDASGGMLRVEDSSPWRPEGEHCALFAAVAGRCLAGGRTVEMPAESLLWFEQAPGALMFVADDAGDEVPGWWIEATPGSGRR